MNASLKSKPPIIIIPKLYTVVHIKFQTKTWRETHIFTLSHCAVPYSSLTFMKNRIKLRLNIMVGVSLYQKKNINTNENKLYQARKTQLHRQTSIPNIPAHGCSTTPPHTTHTTWRCWGWDVRIGSETRKIF